MATLAPPIKFKPLDHAGNIIPGGLVHTYEAGTTTEKDTWADQGKTTLNSNPVELDANGEADIWLDGAYKIVVADADDDPIYTTDNIVGYDAFNFTGLTATVAMLNATDTSTLVKTSNYTMVDADRGKTILVDTTLGAVTITTVPASAARDGYFIRVKKIDTTSNAVTIATPNSETIDGSTSYIVYDYNDTVALLCDGANFRIVNKLTRGFGSVVTKTDAFTVTLADQGTTFVCGGTTNYAATLPSAVTVGKGFEVAFKKSQNLNTVTVTPVSSQTIDDYTSIGLSDDYQYIAIKSDGANWILLGAIGFGGFTTGDVKANIATTEEPGWVRMNDGTIGNASSSATTRANADTKNLFIKLYNNIDNAYAPVLPSRSGDAEADFNDGRTIKLLTSLGHALCNAGNGSGLTARPPGSSDGAETVAITVPQLPAHTHGPGETALTFVTGIAGTPADIFTGSAFPHALGESATTTSTGSGQAHPNVQPSVFLNFFMKL